MAIRYIDMRADPAPDYGTRAAGIGVDSDTNELKYNPNGTVRTLVALDLTQTITGTKTFSAAITASNGISMASASPTSHAINFSSLTLAADCNVIRGTDITPTRTSGWISFSGAVTNTPTAVYTDYRQLTTAGVAEVLGIGSFPTMLSGASCASMFALQAICQVDAGATVLTAGAAPAIGIFPIFSKVLLNGETFNSGGVAAAAFLSFQANVTSVAAEDTSMVNMEIASGGIRSIFKIQDTAAGGGTYLFDFTDDLGKPCSLTNGSDLNDIKDTANAGWIKVRIGSTTRYIPLYAAKA